MYAYLSVFIVHCLDHITVWNFELIVIISSYICYISILVK